MRLGPLTMGISVIALQLLFAGSSKAHMENSVVIDSRSTSAKIVNDLNNTVAQENTIENALYKYSIHPNRVSDMDVTLLEFLGLSNKSGASTFQDRTTVWDAIDVEKKYRNVMNGQVLNKPMRSKDLYSSFEAFLN